MCKVSIVMPTYSGSDKILLPLYGALQQTHKNMEIIVVDDNGEGAPEQLRTRRVLEPLICCGKISYLVHKENKNGAAARNTGWRAASGEFVAFLDDDDVMLPEKIERQLAVLEENAGADVAICGSYFVHEDGRGTVAHPICPREHIQRDYLCGKMNFNTSAMLLRSSAVEKIGGFDETFRRHQDWEFCIRLMERAQFAAADEVLLIKYATGRNVAANPQKAVEFYRHFREKMAEPFSKLSGRDRQEIEMFQQKRLLKTFLLAGDFSGMFHHIREERLSLSLLAAVTADVLQHIVLRMTAGNQKRTLSWDEYMEKAKENLWIGEKE